MSEKIAYGVNVAHKDAFSPPCSANAIRQALKKGELRAVRIGVKPFILAVELTAWALQQKDYRK